MISVRTCSRKVLRDDLKQYWCRFSHFTLLFPVTEGCFLFPFSRHDAGRREHQPEEEVGVCSIQRLGADLAAEGQSWRQLEDHHDRQ